MKVYGQDAIAVEKAGGEVVVYLLAEPAPAGHERVAFVLTRPDPDKDGNPVRHRVALTKCHGWVCDCGDWKWMHRKGRRKQVGEPCCHMAAVQRLVADRRASAGGAA